MVRYMELGSNETCCFGRGLMVCTAHFAFQAPTNEIPCRLDATLVALLGLNGKHCPRSGAVAPVPKST